MLCRNLPSHPPDHPSSGFCLSGYSCLSLKTSFLRQSCTRKLKMEFREKHAFREVDHTLSNLLL